MQTFDGSGAPGDAPWNPREAILRESDSGWRWYAFPNADQLWGMLGLCAGGGILLLCTRLFGETFHALAIGAPFALTCVVVPPWLMWSYLPKRHRQQQRVAIAKALAEKLTAVRFKDGSVSDFSPIGGILLPGGTGLAFDAVHLLGRIITRPGATRLIELDVIWGLDDVVRFEVREVAARGWWERLRRRFGAKQRMYAALSLFRRDGFPMDWPIASGYETAAVKIADTLNRHLPGRKAVEPR